MNSTQRLGRTGVIVGGLLALLVGGCPADNGDAMSGGTRKYVNSTDKSNGGASYVGSAACRSCHSSIAAAHDLHSHASVLTAIDGQPPQYADGRTVPPLPSGFAWTDISYVVGGFGRPARFVDLRGFVLTTTETGVATLWNPGFAPNGAPAGLVEYRPASSPLPFDYALFAPYVTGPSPQDPSAPRFQENRPGMAGAWAEAGAQCEACHGPGARHFTSSAGDAVIHKERIFVDPSGSQSCAQCHSRPFADTSGRIAAQAGFIVGFQQAAELHVSGGHGAFACTTCHDPHVSLAQDRSAAIRNECVVCHTTATSAAHVGKVYTRASDGYTEVLSCESCHMPFASSIATTADPALTNGLGRIGDQRTHIFRVSTENADYTRFFSDDGGAVRVAPDGRAAVTVDFVCLRCHNGNGLFELDVDFASQIASNVHKLPD